MEYRNLHSYKDFLNEKRKIESVNEGLFGFLKKMFNKVKDFGKQIKESGEIDAKFEEAKKELDALFKDKLDDLINDKAAELLKKHGVQPPKAGEDVNTGEPSKETGATGNDDANATVVDPT